MNLLNTILTVLAVIAAFAVAFIAQKQLRESLEARYDDHRPIIIPVDAIRNTSGILGYQADSYNTVQVKNFGPGVALRLEAVLFPPGPNPTNPQDRSLKWHTATKTIIVLDKDAQPETLTFTEGGLNVHGSDQIAGHELWAPFPVETVIQNQPHAIARMTITYWDIFNRKHASVFDYTVQRIWESVVIKTNIKDDLADLNAANQQQIPRG